MAQLNSLQRFGESPKSQIEQLLVGDASRWSPSNSPTSGGKDHHHHHHYLDDDHGHHQKKSVLSRVKEKAKKLRRSLSKKKQQQQTDPEDITTPLSSISSTDMEDYVLEDAEEEEEDAEYLGAPMYESELAPQGYKENAKKHPRAVPVISEKQVLVSNANSGVERLNQKQNPHSPNNKTLTETVTETVAETLAPAYATVSDATHTIASKIQGLTISTTTASETDTKTATKGVDTATKGVDTYISNVEVDNEVSPRGRIWDKGVSVREYIMNKFEPGEDEKALSEVITNAISPRRSPREESVVEKMKEAVTSLLWQEEPTEMQSSGTYSATYPSPPQMLPVSTNAYEVVEEEENHGRILQAN